MEILGIASGAIAALITLTLTPLVRAIALRISFVDKPGPRKIHHESVAYGGGVAVAIGMAAATALMLWGWREILYNAGWIEWKNWLGIGLYASQVKMAANPSLMPFLPVCAAGALGALVLGMVDDKIALSPTAKLTGQFVLAIGVVAGGVRITALVGDNLLMQTATVLWIVLITNSFNLLDNMDGLCSGTVMISAAVLGLLAMQAGQAPLALALCALSGACLGFLRWNMAPAKIFLGDAGSMFVGFLLATLSVVTTYFHYHESVLSVGVPFLILAIPLYDTASVMFIRLREKRNLLKGDTSHFSHRLVDLGMSHRQAVATIHLAALAIALPAVVISRLSTEQGLMLVGQAVLILTLIALLERAGRLKRNKDEQSGSGHV